MSNDTDNAGGTPAGAALLTSVAPASSLQTLSDALEVPSHASLAYRPDVDGLRAISIVAVVAFHAGINGIPGGFAGVDVFFVISGFLIGSVVLNELRSNSFSFVRFYHRRIRRIFPALILVVAVTWSLGWLVLVPDEYSRLGSQIFAGSAFYANVLFWLTSGYFAPRSKDVPLLHLWSLGVEEQFYLVMPLLAFGLWKWKPSLAVPWMVALGAVSFASFVLLQQFHPDAAFYLTSSRFWELMIGVLLAARQTSVQRSLQPVRFANDGVSVLGLTLLLVALLRRSSFEPDIVWRAPLATIGAALLIVSRDAWFNRAILAQSGTVFVGLISYPLYLWHWPLLSFVHITQGGAPSAAMRAGAITAAVLLAWATYRGIEMPIRRGFAQRIATYGCCSLLATVGGIGLATYAFDGLAWRFPAQIRYMADYKYDFRSDAQVGACWISAAAPYDGFAKSCFEPDAANGAGKRRLLVWGDSYAARLYPGIALVFGDRYRIAQLTRDGCAPILENGYETCVRANDFILSEIRRSPPDAVVLEAVWGPAAHEIDWDQNPKIGSQILATIDALRRAGVSHIIVVGPAPLWTETLSRLIYKQWHDHFPHIVPTRLAYGLNPTVPDIDKRLGAIVTSSGTTYISLFDLFCNPTGCLTLAPGSDRDLTTFDTSHLTTPAAAFAAKVIDDKFPSH